MRLKMVAHTANDSIYFMGNLMINYRILCFFLFSQQKMWDKAIIYNYIYIPTDKYNYYYYYIYIHID